MFIVFEGLDGSGKTTQIQRLADRLAAAGQSCHITCQPSGHPVGQLIRRALRGDFAVENETMALLFAADRCQHLAAEITPTLARGTYVLCDRYYYSSLAYQGKSAAVYNKQAMTHHRPDLTLFLDVDPAECMRRITAARAGVDLYEREDKLTQSRTRFLAIFEQLKQTDRVVVIDANADEDTVADRIWQCIESARSVHDNPQ